MADAYKQTEPLRTKIASQTPSCGELQNLEGALGPKGRIGCCGYKWMSFLSKSLSCKRSSTGCEASRNLSERFTRCIKRRYRLSNSPALSPHKGVVRERRTLNWHS